MHVNKGGRNPGQKPCNHTHKEQNLEGTRLEMYGAVGARRQRTDIHMFQGQYGREQQHVTCIIKSW